MSRKVKSARGEVVDFDLLEIQRQLASTPINVDVQQRRQWVDKKVGDKFTAKVAQEPVPTHSPEVQGMLATAAEVQKPRGKKG